jgi:hypothetical protein
MHPIESRTAQNCEVIGGLQFPQLVVVAAHLSYR